jgi:hypothetical protein
MGRGLLRSAHERRGLSGEWRIGLDDATRDDRNLHKGRTGLEQVPVLSCQLSVFSCQFSVLSWFGTVDLNWSRGVGGSE